jgi:hypothetical protein
VAYVAGVYKRGVVGGRVNGKNYPSENFSLNATRPQRAGGLEIAGKRVKHMLFPILRKNEKQQPIDQQQGFKQ